MCEISVIVPVYKVEPYLRRCVDSILGQTFTDFELILVDDGSPDGCPAICDAYAQRDSRVRVIHKENGGVSSARNAGMDVAGGNYIMFCDGDDYVAPFWCACLYEQIIKTPDAWVCADLIRSSEQQTIRVPVEENGGTACETDYYQIYTMGLSAYVVNKIYVARKIRETNLAFDETMQMSEDVDFNLKYLKHCDCCVYVPEYIYIYIQRTSSVMHQYTPDWFRMHLAPFYNRIPFIGKEHLGAYCDSWLYLFLTFFPIVFDKRNPAPWPRKLAYNQRMLTSKEFQFCLHHASGKNENPMVLKLLKSKCYLLYWLFEKAVSLKHRTK